MFKILAIASGGAIGALLRYLVYGISNQYLKGLFPWGTLIANLSGALLIGCLWGLIETHMISQNIRVFLMIGLLGSFTTFSTFCFENFHLLRNGDIAIALTNILLSNILGLALVFGGYFCIRIILR